tara:strand:- start:937 stop:2562 length:1626 start_codon:yes stop_codon:yes gene_type:complete
MKYSNFKRYKFSTVTKNFNTLRHNFFKLFKFADPARYDFKKLSNYLDYRKLYKYLNFRWFNYYKIKRKLDLKKYKNLAVYFIAAIIFSGFIYLIIPIFYTYDKPKIAQTICKDQNIECLIKGKISYSFYPTPRIKINDLIINDSDSKKNTLITIDDVAIKLSIKNLITKNNQIFTKIIFKNFQINIDKKKSVKYKNIFMKRIDTVPIKFVEGKIIFFDKNDYVLIIDNAKLNLKFEENSNKAVLKGKFLEDNIFISLTNKKVDNEMSTNIILKLSDLNLLTKAKLINSKKDKKIINGDILIKKDKHKFTGIFEYKDNEITINKSNIRNVFLDGKLKGKITILPYFNFDMDLNLNSINFTKLYNYFLALDEKKQKNFFRINKKINGKLSVSTERIYSSYNLIKSFESRMQFNNGNILVDQFLINLGKLGAADLLGAINNDKKFINFKYESNIFIDNQKKFLSKFGVYNKENLPSNLFISGNFDLKNLRSSFYEISNDEKLNEEDINFIEQEFNDYMLEDGYSSLFRFPKFKEFIKSITAKDN